MFVIYDSSSDVTCMFL